MTESSDSASACLCRLSEMPPQLEDCTRLETVDLSFNPKLVLNNGQWRDDAELFTNRELGLRRKATDPWPNADTQSMLRIATSFTPAPKIICCADAVDHSLDEDTTYLATWIN